MKARCVTCKKELIHPDAISGYCSRECAEISELSNYEWQKAAQEVWKIWPVFEEQDLEELFIEGFIQGCSYQHRKGSDYTPF